MSCRELMTYIVVAPYRSPTEKELDRVCELAAILARAAKTGIECADRDVPPPTELTQIYAPVVSNYGDFGLDDVPVAELLDQPELRRRILEVWFGDPDDVNTRPLEIAGRPYRIIVAGGESSCDPPDGEGWATLQLLCNCGLLEVLGWQ